MYTKINSPKLSYYRICKLLVILFVVAIFTTKSIRASEVWRITLDPIPSGVLNTQLKATPNGAIYRFYSLDEEIGEQLIGHNYLTRISPDGEIDWDIHFQFSPRFDEMYVDSMDNVYLVSNACCDGPYLRKYSPSGGVLFDNHYPIEEGYNEPEFTIQNVDMGGNITFYGQFITTINGCSNTKGWLAGGSSSGSRTWTKTLGEGVKSAMSYYMDIVGNDNEGGFLLYYLLFANNCTGAECKYIQGCEEEVDTLLARVDGNGNIQWQNNINGKFSSLYVMTPSGNIYEKNYPNQLIRRNPSFDVDWTYNYSNSIYTNLLYLQVVENQQDGSTLIFENNTLVCINKNGSIRWQKQLGITDAMFGPDGDIYGGGGFVIKHINPDTGDEIESMTIPFWVNIIHVDQDGGVTVLSGDTFAKYTFKDYLTIRDAHNDTIPDTEFELYKVENDPPMFTEEYLGKFTTDAEGRLEYTRESEDSISVELDEGTKYLANSDLLKITKHLYSESAPRHQYTLPIMYSVHLDNVKFDDQGVVSFNKVGEDDWTKVILDHTEFRYNLVVSIEWDAEQQYQHGLQKDFRGMSNYLYDVTDGQVRLDEVKIFDNKYAWGYADIRIRATNMHRPNATVNDIYNLQGYPINMPRKWYSSISTNREMTYENHPFSEAVPNNYRTFAHELGHYAFGFLDEYKFIDYQGNELGEPARCEPYPNGNYGFMDSHYTKLEYGEHSSEMSSAYRYSDLNCRNTDQYVTKFMSCWDYFESNFEREYNGIYVPVFKPDIEDETERLTPTGLDYFPGPNNDPLNLNYDVGSKIIFTENVEAPPQFVGPRRILVDNVMRGGVNVILNIEEGASSLSDNNFYRAIDQGNTTGLGLMWVLGVNPMYDKIIITGHDWRYTNGPMAMKSGLLSEVQKQWYYAQSSFGDEDTTHITLNPIQGYYPLIFDASVNIVACELDMDFSQPFNDLPLTKLITNDKLFSYSTQSSGSSYYANITDSIGESGFIRLSAVDGANNSFIIDLEYTIAKDSAANFSKVIGPLASVVVSVDSVNTSLEKMMLLSSPYPVIRNGLSSSAIQAGQAQSLSVNPNISLSGINNLSIYYADDDLKIGNNQTGDETDLQIYFWNKNQSKWELVGGIVDTELNTVTVSFNEPGVYAAFTNTIVTSINDDFRLNQSGKFSLFQNYPNPFNQSTEIEFTLPQTSEIKLDIFNINGQLIRNLINSTLNTGTHKVEWDGKDNHGKNVTSGIYLYRLTADEFVKTKNMVLLK